MESINVDLLCTYSYVPRSCEDPNLVLQDFIPIMACVPYDLGKNIFVAIYFILLENVLDLEANLSVLMPIDCNVIYLKMGNWILF